MSKQRCNVYLVECDRSMIFKQLGTYFLSRLQEVRKGVNESEKNFGSHPHYIYVCSNQKPQYLDWCLDKSTGKIFEYNYEDEPDRVSYISANRIYKIIYSNNPNLPFTNLASDDDIRMCLEAVNSNNISQPNVLVEFETKYYRGELNSTWQEVTYDEYIHKINSITKEELVPKRDEGGQLIFSKNILLPLLSSLSQNDPDIGEELSQLVCKAFQATQAGFGSNSYDNDFAKKWLTKYI